jgi:23S rRNA (uracil1939-C5)-methyltransferase
MVRHFRHYPIAWEYCRRYGLQPVSEAVFCVHQPACVGCPLSHLSLDAQLDFKQQRVANALRQSLVSGLPFVNSPIPAPTTDGYRIRAKLVHDQGQLGLFTDGHKVIDTSECRVLQPRLRHALNQLRALLPLQCTLLAVDARLADEGVLLTLVVPEQPNLPSLKADAERILRAIPDVRGIAYSERHAKSVQVLGGVPLHLAGAQDLVHHLNPAQPYHLAVPGGFVQSHPDQASALHTAIEREVQTRLGSLSKLNIVELYAGAGALALRLAAKGARVTAVEAFAPSVALLERTAAEQRLSLRALASSAEAALPQLDADVMIVDPPRRGLSVDVRSCIATAKPRVIVYVSCEPRTLARDLAHFGWLGYAPALVQPFDMMPHSDSVETLTILTPAATPPLDVLFRDDTLIAVNKPPHIPTIPHAEYPSSLLRLVQQMEGCEQAAPVHRLDVGTSGVCLFAITPAHAFGLATELAQGHKTYTAAAQGVVHKRGTIRHSLLDGRIPRNALTRYERSGMIGTHSLLQAHPQQGRKHQIRRHFAKVHHALLGDTKYGSAASARHFFERYGLDRPFLHCSQIELTHKGEPLTLLAPLAPDLVVVMDLVSRHTRGPTVQHLRSGP